MNITQAKEKLERERDSKLEEAQAERAVKIEQLDKILEYEKKLIQKDYELKLNEIKTMYENDMNNDNAKLKDSERERVGTRYMRSMRKGKDKDILSEMSARFSLSHEDVMQDLKAIQSALQHENSNVQDINEAKQEAAFERKKLKINGTVFVEGDTVQLSKLGGEITYAGEVLFLNHKEEEVEFQLIDGAKVRVPLVHFQTDRVSLKKLSEIEA